MKNSDDFKSDGDEDFLPTAKKKKVTKRIKKAKGKKINGKKTTDLVNKNIGGKFLSFLEKNRLKVNSVISVKENFSIVESEESSYKTIQEETKCSNSQTCDTNKEKKAVLCNSNNNNGSKSPLVPSLVANNLTSSDKNNSNQPPKESNFGNAFSILMSSISNKTKKVTFAEESDSSLSSISTNSLQKI